MLTLAKFNQLLKEGILSLNQVIRSSNEIVNMIVLRKTITEVLKFFKRNQEQFLLREDILRRNLFDLLSDFYFQNLEYKYQEEQRDARAKEREIEAHDVAEFLASISSYTSDLDLLTALAVNELNGNTLIL